MGHETGEPVAFEYQHEDTGVVGYVDQWQIDNGFFVNNPRLQLIGPLYRHPLERIAELEEENLELAKELMEAAEEVESWGAYASDYFQQKHDLAGWVKRFKDRAAKALEE